MATYEFKSLDEIAVHIFDLAAAEEYVSTHAKLARDRNKAEARAAAFRQVARLLRDSVINSGTNVPVTVVGYINANDPSVEFEAKKAYRGQCGHPHDGPFIIAAIKTVRNMTGLGLREAKDYCDARKGNW